MGGMDGSKQANVFVKALEQYVDNENSYIAIGFELSNLLSPRLASRLDKLYDGYNRGREAGM